MFYTGQLLSAPSLSPSTCTAASSGQLPVPPMISKVPGRALLGILKMLCLPLFFWKATFLDLCIIAAAACFRGLHFQQSELQTMLKCRFLLTKLDQSHSFVDNPDNSRGQEQTILKDLLLCFSVFNLLLLKLRGGKEGEKTKKGLEASGAARGPTVLHPSQAPSVLGFVPLCLSLLHSQPQSRAYC